MEYRDWKILKILFEQKNITRTAELLYISQPALTKCLHLKIVEEFVNFVDELDFEEI